MLLVTAGGGLGVVGGVLLRRIGIHLGIAIRSMVAVVAMGVGRGSREMILVVTLRRVGLGRVLVAVWGIDVAGSASKGRGGRVVQHRLSLCLVLCESNRESSRGARKCGAVKSIFCSGSLIWGAKAAESDAVVVLVCER